MKLENLKHAITRSPATYVRLALIALAVFAAAYLIQQPDSETAEFFSFHARNIAVLYAILVGFIASEVISRRLRLDEYVAIELNKIRRLYHLSYHIFLANDGLKQWFEGIETAVINYLLIFKDTALTDYSKGSPAFRNITYSIYSLPSDELKSSQDLYKALLDTTAEATESRQFIKNTLTNNYVGHFAWVILVIVTITFGYFIIGTTPNTLSHKFATGFVIFNLFLILQLIFEYGRINKRKARFYSTLYLNNLESLNLVERAEELSGEKEKENGNGNGRKKKNGALVK